MSLKDLVPIAVDLPGGITLHYVRQGSGPALVFIHGAMGDWRSWEPQWDVFTPQFDCVSYSRRYSHPNPNPMEARDHSALVDAADLEALINALGIDKVVLVGSSYGGFTALAMAVRAPERVAAVISVEAPMMRYAAMSANGADIVREFREKTVLPVRAAFERGEDVAAAELLTGGIAGKRAKPMPADIMERRMQNVAAAKSLSLSNDEFPLLDAGALAALPMPVLLMSGADTAPIHAAIFQEVVQVMPAAKVRVIDGSGHSVSQQRPGCFNSEVLAFLKDNGIGAIPRSDLARSY